MLYFHLGLLSPSSVSILIIGPITLYIGAPKLFWWCSQLWPCWRFPAVRFRHHDRLWTVFVRYFVCPAATFGFRNKFYDHVHLYPACGIYLCAWFLAARVLAEGAAGGRGGSAHHSGGAGGADETV